MSDLVAIAYEDKTSAEEARLALIKMQSQHLVDLEDAVVAVKDDEGKVKLNQAVSLTAAGAAQGGFWGMLIGLLFFSPLLGMAAGAAGGAVGGALSDVGVNNDFMKQLAQALRPGSSVLFVLVRKATPDKVLPEIAKFGGRVLRTSLSNEDEAKIADALAQAKAAAA